MKSICISLLFISTYYSAQNLSQKMDLAVKNLLKTEACSAAQLSVYIADKEGKMLYEYQPNIGLTTASTQKIFTAAAALETLGKDYNYTTTASFTGNIQQNNLQGNLWISSNGDPTLGSWRYDGFEPENFKEKLLQALQQKDILTVKGDLIMDDSYFDFQTIPGGWPWNDLGNYYGAGVWGLNWRENQFDIQMYGKEMKKTNINLPNVQWVNDVKVAGNSDNSLVFTAPHSNIAYINGTLPAKSITVSGATPNPPLTFGDELKKYLQENGIDIMGKITSASQMRIEGNTKTIYPKNNEFFTYSSPKLGKIIYWFMKKSINLYGETLIKTMAKEKMNEGTYQAGMVYLKNFWKNKGINERSINFADGSGLSPQNYVSAKAEVQALLYAQKQPWFNDFFDGFSTHDNGMKMKSGTMKNTKSYAGIYGNYTFSIIINNYQGNNSSEALQKVLNSLK
ncbi:MAG: D-alanyl-D-alanine carboxypeptidase/D-alanyl-D-alanine-endopeptidase [Bacteroidetes bacterium]|nr:D-alanyl-D-alanine carboxypeptidase/D-alanyl-D-alanine-endopeptidase [Bacteroidota bacterium]